MAQHLRYYESAHTHAHTKVCHEHMRCKRARARVRRAYMHAPVLQYMCCQNANGVCPQVCVCTGVCVCVCVCVTYDHAALNWPSLPVPTFPSPILYGSILCGAKTAFVFWFGFSQCTLSRFVQSYVQLLCSYYARPA